MGRGGGRGRGRQRGGKGGDPMVGVEQYPPRPNNTNHPPNPHQPQATPNHPNTQNSNTGKNLQPPTQDSNPRGPKRKRINEDGSYNDGVDDSWSLPRIVHPKFSVTDMRRTMAQAKVLLTAYRRFESLRSNPVSPEDRRSVWHFLSSRRELNTGRMCYFMHQAGFDLDSEGDYIMKSGDVSCSCHDKSKGEIPECYLLVLFYFISAAKVENGLYNFDQRG